MSDDEVTSKNLDELMPDWLLIEGGEDVKEWLRELLILQETHGWDSPQVGQYIDQTLVGIDEDAPTVEDLKSWFGGKA